MRARFKNALKTFALRVGGFLLAHPAYVWLAAMLIAVFFCAAASFSSDAEMPLRGILFFDHSDAGMDHFNSLLATAERRPYTVHHITYPPLAAMLYYLFFSLLDKRFVAQVIAGNASFSARDLRHYSFAVIPYILFTLLSLLLIALTIRHALKLSDKEKTATILGVVLSCGVISALDRGNNILFILGLLMFYTLFYDSENKVMAELALLALAVATGLKLYPVVFGVLLVRKHKYWQGFRAVGYILLALFLPFFFFEGWEAIRLWMENFLLAKVRYVHPGALNLDSILRSFGLVLETELPDILRTLFMALYVFVGLLGAIVYKEGYKSVAFCSFAIIGFAGVSPKYTLALTCLPLVVLLAHGVKKWLDWVYFALLTLLNLPLVFTTSESLEKLGLCGMDLFEGGLVLLIMMILLAEGAVQLVSYIKTGQWKTLLKTERQLAALAEAAKESEGCEAVQTPCDGGENNVGTSDVGV